MPDSCRNVYPILGFMVAIAIVATSLMMPVFAQVDATFAQLPVQEQITLQDGQATVSGSDGQFTGRVLVDAPLSTAWQVVTDYNNFDQFLPTVETSQLLESTGNRRVFEQVNVVRIFPITRRSRVVIAATLSYPQQIDFNLVEGDLNTLQGIWQFEAVSPSAGAPPNQVLITHQVAVTPKGGGLIRGLFFNTYRNVLEDTMSALKQESERRI
ncbi:MAG: SRPBCC family protein [Elainellaceae cyanobacterium]